MFEPLIEECKLRNYSKKTIKIYLHYNQHYLKLCRKKPQEVTQQDIRKYLAHLIKWNKSSSTINLAHNALIFYYSQILKRKFYDIPYQKKGETTREILTKEEILLIHDSLTNTKHRLMISMIYATGVRVQELVKIKINDLDLNKKLLLVRQGKGKRDRYTILSDLVIEEIKDYLMTRKINNHYLFEAKEGHITIATVQAVLKQAKKKSKLNKKVSPHVLRHSFATHLLEAGTDIRYIKDLLGHSNISTTLIYTKVSNKDISNIKSPLDDIKY